MHRNEPSILDSSTLAELPITNLVMAGPDYFRIADNSPTILSFVTITSCYSLFSID
jgi:hypothetical protein